MPSPSSSSMAPPRQRPAPLVVNITAGTETDDDVQVVNKRRRLHHQPAPRQPVIIYVESPRVVHAHAGEFKTVVQRLTGAPKPMAVFPASSAAAPPPLPLQLQFPFQFPSLSVGAVGISALPPPLTSMSVTTTTTASGGGLPVQQLANHPLVSSDPFLPAAPPPSLAACYQQHLVGDLFINHHHR